MALDPKKLAPWVTVAGAFVAVVAGWTKLDDRIEAERVMNNAQNAVILEEKARAAAMQKEMAERGEMLAEVRADVRNIRASVERIERNMGRQANGE